MSSYSNQNNNQWSEIPWWAVIVGFAVFWPIGVGLLIAKLKSESRQDANRRDWLNALDGQPGASKVRYTQNSSGQSRVVRSGEYSARPAESSAPKKSGGGKDRKRIKGGKRWCGIGGAMLGLFGYAAIDEVLSWLPYWSFYAFQETLPLFMLAGVGAGMLTYGIFRNRKARKMRKMINLLGKQKEVDIQALAEAMPCDYNQACDTLQNMIDEGYLGKLAYIDMATGTLILNGKGVSARQPVRTKKAKPAVSEEEAERSVLAEIRRVNDSIPDPELTRKIDRIEEITGHILDYQKKHPEKSGELHNFLNYYLPTTLKILNSYAELDRQGVSGENISTTKERVEGMMDMVVEGFEKQLDKLFVGDMMDISSDISVMEKMLSHDGLTGGMRMEPEASAAPELVLEPDPIPEPAAQPITLDFGGAAAMTPPENSWENGFYSRTKEEIDRIDP